MGNDFPLMLQTVLDLVKQVGEFQLQHWHTIKRNQIADKGLNQLVSFVDQQSELQLIDGCKGLLPDAHFVAEEFHSATTDLRENTWIIDPLDGTTNFLHGLPVFSISVALWRGGALQLGVVHCPAMNETFWAIKDGGAFLNGKTIAVSDTPNLKQSLIATGFPYYEFGKMEAFSGLLQKFMQGTQGIRRMGSAAIDLAYTAMGRFDGFYEMDLAPWDVAAGSLIVMEAGGKVCDFSAGEDYLFGKSIIAGNTEMFEEFASMVMDNLN